MDAAIIPLGTERLVDDLSLLVDHKSVQDSSRIGHEVRRQSGEIIREGMSSKASNLLIEDSLIRVAGPRAYLLLDQRVNVFALRTEQGQIVTLISSIDKSPSSSGDIRPSMVDGVLSESMRMAIEINAEAMVL